MPSFTSRLRAYHDETPMMTGIESPIPILVFNDPSPFTPSTWTRTEMTRLLAAKM